MEKFYNNRNKNNLIITFVFLICSFIITLFFSVKTFYKKAMINDKIHKTYKNRDDFSKDNIYIEKNFPKKEITLGNRDFNIEKWHYINERDFVLTSFAHIQKSYTNKWIVVVHGYEESSSTMGDYGKMFFEEGYNVLLVDNEYHGESEGDHISMGTFDCINVLRWVDEIVKQDDSSEIVLFGLSMGAATVMMASDKKLNPSKHIKAIVEDCGFTSSEDMFSYRLKVEYKLPKLPLIYAVDIFNYFKNGYRFNDKTPLKAVSNTNIPMLFIHGDKDDYVPFYMVHKLFDSHCGEKDIYIVKNAEHANAFDVAGVDYKNKIMKFIENYI